MSLQHTSISKSALTSAAATPAATSLISTLSAIAFGAALLFAVGFSPMDVAHNAAHDARHSLAFPCH